MGCCASSEQKPPVKSAPAVTAKPPQVIAKFPDKVEDVTPAFLSEAVGAKVKAAPHEALGIGYVGDCWKFTLEYEAGATGPKTVVVKLPKPDDTTRAMYAHLFQIEVDFYRTLAAQFPIKTPRCYAACGTRADPGKFCLVFDDCMASGENQGWGSAWMVGLPEDVVSDCLADLARVQAKFWKSPLLGTSDIFTKLPPQCGFGDGHLSLPFGGITRSHYSPWPYATAMGLPEGTTAIACLLELYKDKKDFLKFEYMWTDGSKYLVPDGPWGAGPEALHGEKGMKVHKHVMKLWASRPLTMIHGDGHTGNLFRHKKTKEFTWIDFQGVSRAPAGLELCEALGLGLNPVDKTVVEKCARKYYDVFSNLNPAAAKEYPFEMLWDDFMMGMVLWNMAYTPILLMSLGQLQQEPDRAEERLAGLRMIFPRYITLCCDLGLQDLAEKLFKDAEAA